MRAHRPLGEWDYRPAGTSATVRIVAMACALVSRDVELRLSDEHSDARWFRARRA